MSDVEEQQVRIDQTDKRAMWPFLTAATLILLVILGILIAALVSPAEKNVTDSDRLSLAARGFIQSRSGTDTPKAGAACPDFDENRSPLHVPGGTGKTFEFEGLTDPALDGDKATAQVTFRTGDREDTTTWHFTKNAGTWLVCNSG